VSEPSPAVRRRLDLLRHRRATMVADRAAFESRRRHGVTARHQAKLAYLATRDATETTEPTPDPDLEEASPTTEHDDAA
jgi:hypothetical protein